MAAKNLTRLLLKIGSLADLGAKGGGLDRFRGG